MKTLELLENGEVKKTIECDFIEVVTFVRRGLKIKEINLSFSDEAIADAALDDIAEVIETHDEVKDEYRSIIDFTVFNHNRLFLRTTDERTVLTIEYRKRG